MNFLAHAYLTPPGESGLLVGNLTADFIKGRVRKTLPAELQAGMALHRRIDGFTDAHPVTIACGEKLNARWGAYATVLVDIFYDHCLAANWDRYGVGPLGPFVAHVYGVLREHLDVLPPRAFLAVHAMMADDWLGSYATVEGIATALSRLSRRLRHGVDLAPAADDLRTMRGEFDGAFAEFFPALAAHAQAAPETAP